MISLCWHIWQCQAFVSVSQFFPPSAVRCMSHVEAIRRLFRSVVAYVYLWNVVSVSANTSCICWRAVLSYSTEPNDFLPTFHLTSWRRWICRVSASNCRTNFIQDFFAVHNLIQLNHVLIRIFLLLFTGNLSRRIINVKCLVTQGAIAWLAYFLICRYLHWILLYITLACSSLISLSGRVTRLSSGF